MNRINPHHRFTCGLCNGRAWGRGVDGRRRHLFFCDDCGSKRAKRAADMDKIVFDRMEVDALSDASPRIGEYLDKIGKTDLAKLTPAEWFEFLHRVLFEFKTSMHRLTEAPF